MDKLQLPKSSTLELSMLLTLNSLPDDKVLDWSKLKQIAEDILKCIQNE